MTEKTREPPLYNLIGACETLNLSDKGVLVSLASFANGMGNIAFPSMETLAKRCNISRRRTIDHIQRLKEEGYIRPIGHTRHNVQQYEIVREKLLEPRKEKPKGRAPQKKKIVENVPVTQPKYTLTREEIHAKLEAALHAKKERAQHP